MLSLWYSEQKCLRSQKYASENGLPIMKNVLLPKSKGFCACLEELRDSMDAGTYLHYLFCYLISPLSSGTDIILR